MAFIRRYDEMPSVEILTDIEAVDIIDQAGPAAIAGLAMGTVAVIGEFLKGPVNTPTLITSKQQLLDTFGGVSKYSNPGGDFPQQAAADTTPQAFVSVEGNAIANMAGVKFGGLVVVNVDQSVGTVSITRSATDDAVTLPAGTLLNLSDEANSVYDWFALLEDAEFAAGTDTVSGLKIRRVMGTTASFTADGTVYGQTGFTVTVENSGAVTDLTAATMDTNYTNAIDTLKVDSNPANLATIFVAARHSETIQGYLKTTVEDLSSSGRGRIAVVAPPVGTDLATAEGDTGIGVGNLGRSDRVIYVHPGIIKTSRELANIGVTDSFTFAGDIDAAGLISQTPPEENPGQPTDLLDYFIDVESAMKSYLTIDTYKTYRSKGIMAPRYDKATGWSYQSGVTSVDPSVYPELRNIARRRMADFIQDSLASRLQIYVKKIMNEANKNACVGEVIAFLDMLKKDERIDDYSVDPDSGNTADKLAQGIFTIVASVRLFASMDAIVLNTEIGETVEITSAA